jgi:hypothetical protein
MARVKVAALLIVGAVFCAGCSFFFDFNAYASLDKPPTPTAADYEGAAGLQRLAADLESPAVVAQLAANPTTVDEIKAYLSTTYLSTPLATADQQTAAVLYCDLTLKTTSGDDLVNNVVTTIMSTPQTGNIADLIKSIIPASVLADTTGATFKAMVQGLLDASAVYEELGTDIATYGATPGLNLGDLAQKAAVAYTMRVIVDAVVSQGPPSTDAEAEDEMFKLVTGDPTNTVSGVTVSSDPLNPLPGWLQNIFNAAGVPAPV